MQERLALLTTLISWGLNLIGIAARWHSSTPTLKRAVFGLGIILVVVAGTLGVLHFPGWAAEGTTGQVAPTAGNSITTYNQNGGINNIGPMTVIPEDNSPKWKLQELLNSIDPQILD